MICDMVLIARFASRTISKKDMVSLITTLLGTLLPHLARESVIHHVAKQGNPKVAAQSLIDELTHHFLPKE